MNDATRKPFLSRWSQRKLAASREAAARAENAVPATLPPAAATAAAPAAAAEGEPPALELPPVESLSFDSDFTPFLQPKVDEALKRQALRKLFADPRFNVMDGLDVYIDDYSKFEPIPPEIVAQLNQAKFLFDPPKTRINAQGYAEDVPPEPEAQADEAAQSAEPASIDDKTIDDQPVESSSSDALAMQPDAPVPTPIERSS